MSARKAIVAVYGIVAIATFGHAASNLQAVEDARTAECRAYLGDRAFSCNPHTPKPAMAGMAAAALWPLYWAWEAWS